MLALVKAVGGIPSWLACRSYQKRRDIRIDLLGNEAMMKSSEGALHCFGQESLGTMNSAYGYVTAINAR